MANAEKVAKAGVTRESGWLYYIDKTGNIARSKMVRGGQKKKPGDKAEVVAKTGVTRDNNFIYFMDNNGDVARVPANVYLGDEGALLQTLIPDELPYDMAMNIFTFSTGHSLPVVETHVMEHGLWFLQGKGLYYLDDTWMEVEQDDFIWMGPYVPQSFYATGPVASKYLYYKNVNREIPV